MRYSVAMTTEVNNILFSHLVRKDGQEDLCFALWQPSTGEKRLTALLVEPILPEDGEREVHGNASFSPEYFQRALQIASARDMGLAFMHSHPFPGWQNMSSTDVRAELSHAAATFGITGRPLLGLTIGTDGAWSARFWNRTGIRKYAPSWCESVRTVGQMGLSVTFCDALLKPQGFREELKRTISSWGQDKQDELSRLHIGIVGAGSVGSAIAEALARTGVRHISLIDFDVVKKHNLDRLMHATIKDVGELKTDVIAKRLIEHATADNFLATQLPVHVTGAEGYRGALDCDLLFSCVDRPWARHVLNYIAYTHLIPVVDGGIRVHTKEDLLRSADWRAHTATPGNKCLSCIGQYTFAEVSLERKGLLDDSEYINTVDGLRHHLDNQNVFAFSMHLASMMVLQMLALVVKPNGISHHGENLYHFVTGELERKLGEDCLPNCPFSEFTGKGDSNDDSYQVFDENLK